DRANFPVTPARAEIKAVYRTVVVNGIQNDANAARMRLFQQFLKISLRAKHRINAHEVERVIAVVTGRSKDRREVNALDAQFGQIVQFVDHAAQVAAKEVAAK